MSRSSALSIILLLIFDIHDPNGALFLKSSFLFLLLSLFVPVTVIVPLQQYMHHYSHINLILTFNF